MGSYDDPKPITTRSGSPLNLIVVGAGLGGLATAISSSLAGHQVTVFEAASELAEIGAGLQLTPNGTRILLRWGLGSVIERVAAEPTAVIVHRYSDGKILAEERNFDEKMRNKHGAPFLDVHRVDLQNILYDKAVSLGVKIHLRSRVARVEATLSGPRVVFESGGSTCGDMVVGADGLWSKCRLGVSDQGGDPCPTGDLAYRVALDLDELKDPELRRLVASPEVRFWIGPNSHAVGYSLRGGTSYNIVLLCPSDLPDEVMRSKGSIEEMQKRFSGWHNVLTRFLSYVDDVDKWKLMYREGAQAWTAPEKHLVLIGDSCHPMLPYLAQGANSALEDAAVLGHVLSHVRSPTDIPCAISLFENLRRPRVERIVRETFGQRDDFHMADGTEQEHRDDIFASYLGKEITGKFPSRWTCPETQNWLYGYDSDLEAANGVRSSALWKDFAISTLN